MRRGVESRQGRPQRNPEATGKVGWGIVVGAWESHAHEDKHSGRRPLACGKTGTKVPSERASCPRGMHCGAGEMGTDASWMSMENDQRCCAVCGESRMHGAKRGG